MLAVAAVRVDRVAVHADSSGAHIGAVRGVDEEFLELICADEEPVAVRDAPLRMPFKYQSWISLHRCAQGICDRHPRHGLCRRWGRG